MFPKVTNEVVEQGCGWMARGFEGRLPAQFDFAISALRNFYEGTNSHNATSCSAAGKDACKTLKAY